MKFDCAGIGRFLNVGVDPLVVWGASSLELAGG